MSGSVGKRRSSSRRDDSSRQEETKKKRDSMSTIYLKSQGKVQYNQWFSPSGIQHQASGHGSQLISPKGKTSSSIHSEKAKFKVDSKRHGGASKKGGSVEKFQTASGLINEMVKQDRIVMPVDRYASNTASAKQLFSKTLSSPPRGTNPKNINLKGGRGSHQASIHAGGYQTHRPNESKEV